MEERIEREVAHPEVGGKSWFIENLFLKPGSKWVPITHDSSRRKGQILDVTEEEQIVLAFICLTPTS